MSGLQEDADLRSQTGQVLDALQRGPLTPLDALRDLGIFRLAARVCDLRMAGHAIVTEKVTQGGKRFARYRLVRRGQA